MIDSLLRHILRRRPATRFAKFAWVAFLALFPVAYFTGSILEQRLSRGNGVNITVDRATALATARQFFNEQGIDVTTWSGYASLSPDENLIAYYKLHRDATALAAQTFAPAIGIRTVFRSPDGDIARAELDPNGRVAGYDLTRIKSVTRAQTMNDAQTVAIATAAASRIPNLTKVIALGKADVSTLERAGGTCQKFTWHGANNELPGLTFEVNASVCGTRPVQQTATTKLDNIYATAHSLGKASFLGVVLVIYGIYVFFVVVYSLYRYARRSMEREASHRRTLLLAAWITAAMLLSLATAFDEYAVGVSGQSAVWLPLLVIGIMYSIGGLVYAVAYEAGEGDVRELHPGKMTSLDAFMKGKLFSRNVARSAIFGIAVGGWMLLAESLTMMGLGLGSLGFSSNMLKLLFFRYPLLAVFTGQAVSVTLIPATALLLPLAFLERHVRRRHLRSALLLVFVVLGCLLAAIGYDSLSPAVVAVFATAGCILGSFLGMDFLAVMFGILALAVAGSLSRMVPLASPWEYSGIGVGLLAMAFVGLESWAAFRGREYGDDEVRPLYAKNIVERQTLQAEVAAAREAQLHLLPKETPNIYGLSISAACIPARVVGGDFYDFFPLGESRLGVFIAEGSNRGIGSALNIALAKGFLMHTVRRNLAPHEVVAKLQAALGTYLGDSSAATYVAYAVLDTSTGQLRYARTGEYPKVLAPSRPVKERRVEMPGSDQFVWEGTAELRGGDTVLLFTNGIANRVRPGAGAGAGDEMLRQLNRKRRASDLEDDLTAVVIRVEKIGSAMEVVA